MSITRSGSQRRREGQHRRDDESQFSSCLLYTSYREVGLLRITQIETKLRTGIHEDIQSSCLPTPCQMREDWPLNIVDGTLVSHRLFGFGYNPVSYTHLDVVDAIAIWREGIRHEKRTDFRRLFCVVLLVVVDFLSV